MKQRPRIYYSETQKAVMWERWKKGDSLHQIAQLFHRNHSAIQGILVRTGGIRPAQRHRSPLALTLAEREEISRSLATGLSIRAIAEGSSERPRLSAVKSTEMVARTAIVQARPTRQPWIAPVVLKAVSW